MASLLALVTFLLTAELFAAQDTLPLLYSPTSRQGDGSTCPLDGRATIINETRGGVRTLIRESVSLFCDVNFGWRRVAFLNMSDQDEQCPSPWREYTSARVCGRQTSSGPSCSSVNYTNSGGQYSFVCGRIIGYAYDSPDAFRRGRDIDEIYADGVSVTHGQPRQHIWSFVAGLDEDNAAQPNENCPCDNPDNEQNVPSFVGNNYFCETGNPGVWSGRDGNKILLDKCNISELPLPTREACLTFFVDDSCNIGVREVAMVSDSQFELVEGGGASPLADV